MNEPTQEERKLARKYRPRSVVTYMKYHVEVFDTPDGAERRLAEIKEEGYDYMPIGRNKESVRVIGIANSLCARCRSDGKGEAVFMVAPEVDVLHGRTFNLNETFPLCSTCLTYDFTQVTDKMLGCGQ